MPIQLDYSDNTHCVHGVYVGGACGPDYMCGMCEMGDGPYIVPEIYPWEQWTLNHPEKPHTAHIIETLNWACRTATHGALERIEPLNVNRPMWLGELIQAANLSESERR